ncbi:MAG: FAD:protein FMN transferase [Clostridiales bacterium]|nr:FAD:protein FMN transferase [Clostridiales bacterium]
MRKKLYLILYALLSILIVLSATGCDSNRFYQQYSYEFFGTFDTVVQIKGYTKNKKQFDEYAQYSHDRFLHLNALFDIYNDYDSINNIKAINDNAGIQPIIVSNEIIELIELSIKYYTDYSQKVNVAMGPVLNIWHIYRESGNKAPNSATLPPLAELEAASQLTNIYDITINKENMTVFLEKKGMRLDLGAVAKGYATELVANELNEEGFNSFLITSGGNVKTVGSPKSDEKSNWGIGLQNPFYFDDSKQDNLIDVVYVSDTSVVSSGDYQRYYTVDDTRLHHIIDPETLMPANNFRAVAVITQDSTLADFLSTALFILSFEDGKALVERLEETDAYWVFGDGTVYATKPLVSKLKTYSNKTQ